MDNLLNLTGLATDHLWKNALSKITAIQKLLFIFGEAGDEHRKDKFAIIIGKAHSSQDDKVSKNNRLKSVKIE